MIKGSPVGETLRGVVRLQVPRRVKSLEKYEGIVLSLVGQEVWMLDGRPLRQKSNSQRSLNWNSQHEPEQVDPFSLRHVKVAKMITDFEFTQVGDGIDFRFPYALEVPEMPARSHEDDDDEEDEMPPGLAFSSRSISSTLSGDVTPTKQIVYTLRASLKRKPDTTLNEPSSSPLKTSQGVCSPPQSVVCSQ